MKKEVELPILPGRLYWEWDEEHLPLTRSNLASLHILRLRIVKKWGWFTRQVVVGDWFALLPGSAEDKETAVRMQSDMLVLQLPERISAAEFADRA